LDVSWTNYFTECKSKGRAYFKGKIQTGGQAGGKAGAQGGSCPPCPPAGAAHVTRKILSAVFCLNILQLHSIGLSFVWRSVYLVQL